MIYQGYIDLWHELSLRMVYNLQGWQRWVEDVENDDDVSTRFKLSKMLRRKAGTAFRFRKFYLENPIQKIDESCKKM